MRLEVRCCCQPQKLLGWMEIGSMPSGKSIRFALAWKNGRTTDMTLPFAYYQPEHGEMRLALKAEGMDVEELKRCRSFTPADCHTSLK